MVLLLAIQSGSSSVSEESVCPCEFCKGVSLENVCPYEFCFLVDLHVHVIIVARK